MHTQFRHYWRLLVTYLKPQWLSVVLLSILLMSNIVLQLINPQVIRYFIDATQAGRPLPALLIAAGLFLAIAFLQRTVAFSSTYTAENVGWTATNALRADLALHCLRLDMSFHKTHTPGELIERIDSDVTMLANFFSQFIIQVLGNALLIGGVLLLLWREDWRVGIALTLYSILTFIILRLLQNVAVKQWASERQANAGFYGFLEEHLTGTEDIRAAGAEVYVTRLLFSHLGRLLETYRRARLVSNLTFFSTNFLHVFGYTAGLALGAYLYIQHQISIGTAYLFVYYIGMLSTPLQTIKEQVEDLQQASASIERVEELFRIQSHLQDQGHTTLPSDALAVAFRSVTFSYDGQQDVLQDISFQLQPGEVLGLLGRTGSGKTTISRLLFRLHDPTEGVVRLGETDIRAARLDALRTRIGLVTQDVQLFQGTLRDNVTLFDPNVPDARLSEVFNQLALEDWLR